MCPRRNISRYYVKCIHTNIDIITMSFYYHYFRHYLKAHLNYFYVYMFSKISHWNSDMRKLQHRSKSKHTNTSQQFLYENDRRKKNQSRSEVIGLQVVYVLNSIIIQLSWEFHRTEHFAL